MRSQRRRPPLSPKPRRRLHPGLYAAVVVIVAAMVLAVHAPQWSPKAASARPAPPLRGGATIDIRAELKTSLPTQYENTVFLQDNKPFSLQLDYEATQRKGYQLRVRWRCNGGALAHERSEAQNRFTPPRRGAVSTIEVELGLYPERYGEVAKAPVQRRKATLRVISPAPGIRLRNGIIDGFNIGKYLDPADPAVREKFGNSWAMIYPEKFLPPQAFYLVDDASRDLYISPHLKLGQYALDYPWFTLGKRQYVALDYRLVRKFEDLIAELNRAGLAGDKISVLYGFRPPSYNLGQMENDGAKALKAPFSFHQYGQAIDVIIDSDGDLRLDDLDGDGRITVRDAAKLAHYVNVLDRRYRSRGETLYGGAGIYDHHDFWKRPVQTPYVHMDVRGFLNENGTLIRWPSKWPDTGEPISWGKL